MPQLTIAEIHHQFNNNPALEPAIQSMIETSLAARSFYLPPAAIEATNLQLLTTASVAIEGEDAIIVQYRSFLVCDVFLRIAQQKLGTVLPHDPLAAIQFVEEFCLLIRQPNPGNYWYAELREVLSAYTLLLLNQQYGVDVIAYIIASDKLTDQSADNLVRAGQEALPYLTSSAEVLYQFLLLTHFDEQPAYLVHESMYSLSEQQPDKAAVLFKLIDKEGANKIPNTYYKLIEALYRSDEAFYFEKAMHCFKEDVNKGCRLFSVLRYGSVDRLQGVYDLITRHPDQSIDFLLLKNRVLATLVSNPHCTKELKDTIFNDFLTAAAVEDADFQDELASRISYLPGFDEEKLRLFPVFEKVGAPMFYMNWFQCFDQPDGLFGIVRAVYEQEGDNANIQRFEYCFLSVQERHPEAFNTLLIDLWTGNTTYGAQAALTILSFETFNAYLDDILDLSVATEEQQVKMIGSMNPFPGTIENKRLIVLQFHKSAYPAIVEHALQMPD